MSEQPADCTERPPSGDNPTPAADDLRSVLEVSRVVHASLNAENLPHVVVVETAARFGFEHVLLFVPDESGGLRLEAASSEQHQQAAAQGLVLSLDGSSAAARAAVQRIPVAEDSGNLLPGAGAAIALPLLKQDHLVGVMVIHSGTPRSFTRSRVEALQLLADQAAVALLNARGLGTLRASIQKLQQENTRYRTALEHMQGMAARQQVVGEVAAQLQRAVQVQEVLETTVRVLHSTLDGYDISLRLAPPQSGRDDQTGTQDDKG